VVARWYPDKRGLGMGILTMGLGLGAFLLGGSTSMLIDSLGWQSAFKFLALVALVVCVGGAALIKLPPAGFAPAGKAPAGAQVAAAGPQRAVKDYNWNEMMQTGPFWTWFVWDLFLCSAGLMIIGHIVPMAVEKGVDKAEAIIAMSILSVSNGLGRFLYGYLWDAIGRKKTMVLAAIGMVIGLLGLLYLTTWVGYAGFILAVIITGSSYGGLVPINNTFLATSFGPKNAGVNVGLGSLPLVAAVFIGPYLGAHIKMASGYDLAIILGGAVAVISFIVAFFIGDAQEQAGQ
jgi:OFA family oxalate/formate antiporter-like MFS transporter